jgi:HPt (histidine-containing phosphotransfer) domain-containing protein
VKKKMSEGMSRSVRIQILLTPKDYIEAVNQAKTYNISYSNDSQLFRGILSVFINGLPAKIIQIEQMQKAIDKKNGLINELTEQIHELKLKNLRAGGKKK